jgi:hypothetical protein
MKAKHLLLLFFYMALAVSAGAQDKTAAKKTRILILLDESSSMIRPWGSGKLKYKAAGELILRLMDSVYAVNNEVEFSLRVFGHQSEVGDHNCYDTKIEVPFARENQVQMALRLSDIRPLGITPIAYSLSEAATNDLTDPGTYNYSIILITDGGESCEGDICKVAKMLIKNKIHFRPYIVSMEDDASLKQVYDCMGEYLQVTQDAEINRAVTTIIGGFQIKPPVPKLMQTMQVPKLKLRDERTAAVGLRTANLLTIAAITPQSMRPPALLQVPGMPPVIIEEAPIPVIMALPTPKVEAPETGTTSFEVYFVNAKGKYYLSQPRVQLLKTGTKTVVKEFVRKIDGLGNLETHKNVNVGYYDLAFPTKKGLALNNVHLENKPLNKLIVPVKDTRITFVYSDNPSRPVSEFKALIKQLNMPPGQGRTENQSCAEAMDYEPGTYDIEINTFPKDKIRLETDFNEDTVISLLQPGWAKFKAEDLKMHFVTLYRNLNDRFVFFYTLDINDTESTHLRMQPGKYQVHYQLGSGKPLGDELVVPFEIVGTKETEVELK